MRKLNKVKLNQLNEAELSERELNRLLGGTRCCICGCQGPSGSNDNFSANINGGSSGLYSPSGGFGHGSFSTPTTV